MPSNNAEVKRAIRDYMSNQGGPVPFDEVRHALDSQGVADVDVDLAFRQLRTQGHVEPVSGSTSETLFDLTDQGQE